MKTALDVLQCRFFYCSYLIMRLEEKTGYSEVYDWKNLELSGKINILSYFPLYICDVFRQVGTVMCNKVWRSSPKKYSAVKRNVCFACAAK